MKRLFVGLMLVLLATAPSFAKQSGMMCSKKGDCCQKMKGECTCCKGMMHKNMKHKGMNHKNMKHMQR